MCIRFPSNLFDTQGPGENREVNLYRDSNCTILAKEIMVSKGIGSLSRSSTGATSQSRPADTGAVTASGPRSSQPSGMETEHRALLEEGLSEEVIDTIQHSIRGSSVRCYNRLWAVFANWCSQKGTDPCSAPLNQVLAFLQSLLNTFILF